jgi:hypothetical protein
VAPIAKKLARISHERLEERSDREKPLKAGGVPGKNPQGSADCALRYMYHGVRVDAKVMLG